MDEVVLLPELWVPEASQWLSTSAGRVALEGYSWMQAVHWVAGSGLYKPRRHRSHGPRSFGPTTVRVAQELAQLFPCRPGIEYLVRRTGLSERSVEYHLGMLREAGLLAYIVRGTRVRGEAPQASEFARMIPVEFDVALGIRTVQRDEDAPAYTRAASGIAEAGRELMAKLAQKASRKVRKSRSKTSVKGARKGAEQGVVTAVSDEVRCTPMQVGTSASSTAGDTSFPPESKLASGVSKSPTPKKSGGKADGHRKLNVVGRRFQLARELIQELDWLRGCSVPRIAWVARNVADAGWTVAEVKGWLHLRGEAARVRRGSGLLAVLLAGAETVLDTPQKRADAIEQWRGAQEAARRHRIQQVRARSERYEGDWDAPTSRAVRSEVEAAFAQVREAANGGRRQDLGDVADDQALALEPSEQELAELRAAAAGELMRGETTLIRSLDPEMSLRIFGERLVRRADQLEDGSRSSLMTYGHR
ncbi:helix-turn-helix transcriptional regulator [Streptomyces sp. MBT56]|uniref:helix-turn-helix domain-containing protein n=1 Tax=unclassified Streptomyces TaxID=2593676 RepID=UPI00190CEE69|nr:MULTISPECIES: helix-turn-helix domain-containing protein [unclassified Streptomyces]MBK3557250.1 helix-turn-helix transcriptional regulator [Streptomyces sp. MBT56]MBK3601827.1 helix-turn-helix transcriptional regulator [Streptomyces sp. MBT54]MBK3616031.1 helix-turn-helix transcriptional regulator [Streptomyces sp. MBT98]